MVIFNGFWAGFISGFVVFGILILAYAMVVTFKQEQAKKEMAAFMNNLDLAAKDIVEKGDLKNESNN